MEEGPSKAPRLPYAGPAESKEERVLKEKKAATARVKEEREHSRAAFAARRRALDEEEAASEEAHAELVRDAEEAQKKAKDDVLRHPKPPLGSGHVPSTSLKPDAGLHKSF